jgi:hypothetical protein
LRISDAARGAEDAKELIAPTAEPPEHAQLLKNHRPGDDGKKKEQREHATRHPSGIGQNAAKVD